jgi:exosortase A
MSATTSDTPARNLIIPSVVALIAGLLALIGLFLPECMAAVRVWIESTAYGHCFLVAPIAAYLVWDRRDALRGIMPQPTPLFALLGLPLPFAWLLAERLGIMEGRQLVAMAAVELLFLTVLGWRLFYALSGPLLYLLFMVPFGAFLTTPLQNFTAWFIDVGLTILNIPHVMTDMTIEISSGAFYVAEACAGLRFLIASVAFGVFFALLNYRSPGRRVAFMAASIIVPIVANGFRALGIVVLGNILGSAEAAAADHLIYGWVFFSFVMLLLVAAGLPFREVMAEPPVIGRSIGAARPAAVRPWTVMLVVAIIAVGPLAALALDRRVVPASLAAAPSLVAPVGCTLAPAPSAAPGHAAAVVECADHRWAINMQALPARSTSAAMAEAKRVLIGAIDVDETTFAALPGLPEWQVMVSREPPRIIAMASWVDGAPATGGLNQRLLQARNSILGAAMEPMVMTIATNPDKRLTDAALQQMAVQLRSIIEAQSGLAQQIALLTAPNSPPLPQ